VGGSLTANVPRNEFLCTTRPYTNFVLRLKFKLTGKSGFINAGVQIRSQRLKQPEHEMRGYQADMAENNYWGSIYDERGRGMLAEGWKGKAETVVKAKDWNEYEILCDGDHIQLKLNGLVTADIHDSAKLEGIIALQIHAGPPMEAYFRNVRIKILK